jgi:Restriction endonuclease EcoRV
MRPELGRFDPLSPVGSFKGLLPGLLKGYKFDVEGLYFADGSVRPLPREAAVVGKVLEISIHEYLARRLLQVPQLKWIPASSDRVYPDVTFNGPLIHPHRFALDVKCARRAASGERTASAITIGTFDADYFRNPDVKAPNIMMPYSSYAAHLSLVALYSYAEATARQVELLVVEKWRIATKRRSSGTRC